MANTWLEKWLWLNWH